MARLFITYATDDQAFAQQLSASLEQCGHVVWLDVWQIAVGDSLWSSIAAGLEWADYVVAVFSQQTALSPWVERELQIALSAEIAQQRTIILPALIETCSLPAFVRARRFADFRFSYEYGFAQLQAATEMLSTQLVSPASGALTSKVPNASGQSNDVWYTTNTMVRVPTLTTLNIELSLPYIGKVSGTWEPDEKEQSAAWELYVELATRVSLAGLQPNEGLLRESLSSLYVIFTTTRDILRKYGPAIARTKADGQLSFGVVALHVLNYALRPVLATWHPLLLDYEHRKDPSVSAYAHERAWQQSGELRRVLADTQHVLQAYAAILARVAGVPQLAELDARPITSIEPLAEER